MLAKRVVQPFGRNTVSTGVKLQDYQFCTNKSVMQFSQFSRPGAIPVGGYFGAVAGVKKCWELKYE